MKIINKYLFIILLIIVYSQQKISLLKETKCQIKKEKGFYLITVLIGIQPLILRLNTRFQGVYIFSNEITSSGFNISKSHSFAIIDQYYSTVFGSGLIGSDSFQIPSLNIQYERIAFFLVKNTVHNHNGFDGYLGLGYDFEDTDDKSKNASFDIFRIFNEIDSNYRKIMGFLAKNYKTGEIIVGNYPAEVKNNFKQYKVCSLFNPTGKFHWNCLLDSIYFNDNKFYRVKELVNIAIGGNMILVPEAFFNFLKDNYFKYEIENRICEIRKKKYTSIVCQKRFFNPIVIGNISFIFGKISLKIKSSKLFNEIDDELIFNIVTDDTKNNTWIISPGVLIDYYVFYDKDNKVVGFYKLE